MFGVDEDQQEELSSEVCAELDRLAKPKTSWGQAAIVLAASMLLFSAAGTLGDSMSNLPR